jgi:uncharacterized protein YceK
MRGIAFGIAVSLLLSGCASMFATATQERQSVSSGFIGCAPSEIEIIHTGDYTWTAICKGRKFYCNVGGPSASCTPEMR